MATWDCSQGYQSQPLDSTNIPEELYCKKCNLVARRLIITSCCGESFCHACIADTQEQGKPCPKCGDIEFTIFEQKKSQRKISTTHVYCGMKERGCVWSGSLEQLDTHLDPDQDNCQYVDTKCPLNCQQIISKREVEQHVTEHCLLREYTCQYCSFKSTYEEIKECHIPQCNYVPLQCPNRCGVTFERDFMEDHMKMCRLQEIGCEFSGVGCNDRFRREDQEEHTRQNSQKHLTLTASLAVDSKELLLQQEEKHKKEVEQLNQIIQELKDNQAEQGRKLEEFEKKNMKDMEDLQLELGLLQKFEMKKFSQEKAKAREKSGPWKSPAMYTHKSGYKFYIGVDANGCGGGHGKSIYVHAWAIPGEFDSLLQWPVTAEFTLELVNVCRGKNATHSVKWTWDKSNTPQRLGGFCPNFERGTGYFLRHSDLEEFIFDDTLCFHITNIGVSRAPIS